MSPRSDIENLPDTLISEALEALNSGELVVFPTDTLFGIAADALNISAVEKLFLAKKRPWHKPLPVMIPSLDRLEEIALHIPEYAKILAEQHWPGPLTLILPKTDYIPDLVTAGLNTVSLRIPDHRTALELLRRYGKPLAVTSANLSGETAVEDFIRVKKQFQNTAAVIIPGTLKHRKPSTIVDCTADVPLVLREGVLKLS